MPKTSNPTTRGVGSNGGAYTYDDMQGSLPTAKLPTANAATWTDITLDSFTFKALAFGVGDSVDLFVQTSHSVRLNDLIENHIHWTIATDDDGDEIRFQLTGVGAGIHESFQSIGTLDSGDVVLSGNAGKHNLMELGDIPAINSTVSSVFILRLTRVAVNDGNDSAEDVYVLFNDSHVKVDTVGSLIENRKS